MFKRKIKNGGFVVLASMIFIVIFACLSIAMVSMSSMNAQLARNHHQGNKSFANTLSGLDFMRLQLEGQFIKWPDRIVGLTPIIQDQLSDMTDVSVSLSADKIMHISDVVISDDSTQSFNAKLSHLIDANDGYEKLRVKVQGKNGDLSKKVQVDYLFWVGGHSVFDFGVATKGPLSLTGQAEIDANSTDPNLIRVEAGVYIEGVPGSNGDSLAMSGQASIAGEVSIYDPNSTYDIGTKSVVGGADAGSDEYISTGVDFIDFPIPYPQQFESMATGDVINSSNKSSYSSHTVFTNCLIEPYTDFTFASDSVIKGILYVKSPNKIKFAGKVQVYGMIVCEGDYLNETITDSVDFSGQVFSGDVATLAGDPEFDGVDLSIYDGTFLLAPGFSTDFSGQANFIDGVIAANGVSFSGQAGGMVNGSIINYSKETMDLSGQSELVFNRSGSHNNPAGFVPYSKLVYMPSSYTELGN